MINLEDLSKEELIEMLKKGKESGRKNQVLSIIKEGRFTIGEIGKKIGIENRNVSTLLSYLKKDGWTFGKDSKGRIVLEDKEE